jgi:hypothetical protein
MPERPNGDGRAALVEEILRGRPRPLPESVKHVLLSLEAANR